MKPIWREWLVAISIVIPMMNSGIMYAFPACLMPGVNKDTDITRDDAVLTGTTFSVCGALSFFIIPPIMQQYGRKASHITLHASTILGSIIVALSQNMIIMIIGRCLQGISTASILISTVLIGEYSHPKRRASFAVLKVLSICIGITLLHGMSFTFTWRQLAWLTVFPSAFAVVLTFTWPESPSWLAYKGRFDECVDAFVWLRGRSEESLKEVKELISAQQVIQQKVRKHKGFAGFFKAMSTKHFLMPIFVLVVAVILNQACGISYLVSYIIEIMLEMSGGDRSMAFYYTMGFDCIKAFAVLMSMIILKYIKRRTILSFGGFVPAVLLFSVCIIQYLYDINVHKIIWLAPLTLTLYDLVCCAMITPILLLLRSELIPLEFRGSGVVIIGVVETSSTAAVIKLTAVLLDSFKIYGTFMIYLVVMVLCLVILYFTLPETKDRTLQDIESEFANIKLDDFAKEYDEVTIILDHIDQKICKTRIK